MRHDLAFCQLLRSKGFVTHDGYPASGGGGHGARTSSSLYGIVVKKRSRLVSFAARGRSKVRPIMVIPGQAVHGSPEEAIRRGSARDGWEVAVRFICENKHVARSGTFALVFLQGSSPEPRRRIVTGYPVAPVLSWLGRGTRPGAHFRAAHDHATRLDFALHALSQGFNIDLSGRRNSPALDFRQHRDNEFSGLV